METEKRTGTLADFFDEFERIMSAALHDGVYTRLNFDDPDTQREIAIFVVPHGHKVKWIREDKLQ